MAEATKIRNLQERLVVVNHGWQSKSTDGPKGGWNVELSICLSIHLSIYPSFLSTDLSVCQPIHLSVLPSICLALYLSMQPSIHHPILVYESVRKDTVDCFHLRSGCSKPSSFPCLCIHVVPPNNKQKPHKKQQHPHLHCEHVE